MNKLFFFSLKINMKIVSKEVKLKKKLIAQKKKLAEKI
jgi:hypothetical protein